ADAPFGLPVRPTPFSVQVSLTMGGEEVVDRLPVQFRYEGDIFSGEKRTDLLVVPAFSVRVTPEIAIVPASSIRSTRAPTPRPAATGNGAAPRPASAASGAPTADREIRVTVVNDQKSAAETTVHLELP